MVVVLVKVDVDVASQLLHLRGHSVRITFATGLSKMKHSAFGMNRHRGGSSFPWHVSRVVVVVVEVVVVVVVVVVVWVVVVWVVVVIVVDVVVHTVFASTARVKSWHTPDSFT